MTKAKAQFGYALLVPAILALSMSGASAQRQSADAVRADCMRQANEAAASVPSFSPAAAADRNTRGVSVYRECVRKHGVRP
jgi:hypothetical protein